MLAQVWLVATLLWLSGRVWYALISRVRSKHPFLEMNNEPRCRWNSVWELVGVYLSLLWLLLHLAPIFFRSGETSKGSPGLDDIALSTVIGLAVSVVLPLVIASGERSFAGIGYRSTKLFEQFQLGLLGFFAALLPMAISMTLTLPLRNLDHQHSLLKLLTDSPSVTTISLIVFTAVICAPLLEELIFRVILQSWLATLFPPVVAISVVAIAFSLVHGWRDGLALLPLSVILGYVFYRRHSYLAVVVIHALFNATMLGVQLLNPRISQ